MLQVVVAVVVLLHVSKLQLQLRQIGENTHRKKVSEWGKVRQGKREGSQRESERARGSERVQKKASIAAACGRLWHHFEAAVLV